MAVVEEGFALISEATAKYISNYVLKVGKDTLAEGFNTGNASQAEEIEANGAQYSAYLEGNVCDFCRALDGLTVDLRDPNGYEIFDKYSPAQHPNCNCIWIYILEDNFRNNNATFDKKWEENFKKQNPELKDMSRPEIVKNFAGSNLFTRAQYWTKEPGFNIVSKETMDKKITKINSKIKKDIEKLLNKKQYENFTDEKEMLKFLKSKEFKDWNKALSKAEKEAFKNYTGMGYVAFNDFLRGNLPEWKLKSYNTSKKEIMDCVRAVMKGACPKDIVTYRSEFALPKHFKPMDTFKKTGNVKDIIGMEITQPGFSSTTLDRDVMEHRFKGDVKYKINVPKGTPCGSGAYGKFKNETEILLAPGMDMKIIAAEYKNDKLYLEVDIIGWGKKK